MPPPQKETKAQRAERLKLEKNPWECLEEIRQFARLGYDAVSPEWRSNYLRWWGIYPQGDGLGVLGGKGGEGQSVPFFMLRIRVPNGLLYSHQLRVIADLAKQYARGVADITVRHNVQLHWIPIEALPDIFERLWRCGLTTMSACGDDTRNITGCPLAGIDAGEICDASPLVLRATQMLVGNPEFYNLPRKYKICITGCRSWCCYPEINDVGLTATKRIRGGREEIGFSLRVGGGLSAEPFFARRLNAFVEWNQVSAVITGVTRIFRDADVLRQHRERARLKYLFKQHGWTEESFQAELERRIGFQLDPAEHEEAPVDVFRDHVGVHAQKQPGYFYVGASVLRGRITPDQMLAAAELADSFGSGELRTTTTQSLMIINVPERNVGEVADELTAVGLPVNVTSFRRGTITCTGTEFCRLAITETKNFARWLIGELEDRLPGFEQHLKLHITGCPNSCGQHWISDIGIEGKKLKVEGQFVDAYYFCVGGAVGALQSIARPLGYRCAATEVPAAIERLLRAYLATRLRGENLRSFFARHSDTELRSYLAGTETAPVERDPSPGRIPVGVSG
ncbi:MAG TPA: nitrite reductase [Bryobacteraceae bacterium]|jgi:sulfite reductase (ferredoxin)|nr:nitrite reductase [Bryobacteraceae bacterium]